MQTAPISRPVQSWKTGELFFFRFFFLYFLTHLLPLDWLSRQQAISFWQHPHHYITLFNLANYAPHFWDTTPTYADWALIALIAIAGTVVWTWLDYGRTPHYTTWYYWLRVVLRCR